MPIRTHLVRSFTNSSAEGGGGSQSAVSLTPADGEELNSGVQSNFDNDGYFTRNGFTSAANWTGANPIGGADFDGMDDVTFLPICIWAPVFSQDATGYNRADDVGLTGFLPASGAVDLEMAVDRGKFCVVPHGDWPGGTVTTAEDPAVIGVIGGEEPSTVAEFNAIASNVSTWMATSDGPGRLAHWNFFHNLMNGDIDFTLFPDDMVAVADYVTCDQYWYAGSSYDSVSRTVLVLRLYGEDGEPNDESQCARGSNYGSMMDSVRKQFAAGAIAPMGMWIEAGGPYTETASLIMDPNMLRWAVWSTLVHGARGIHYFAHNFHPDYPGTGMAPWDDYLGGPGVPGTGIYAAMKEVNTRALALAPVLNSPWDGYFCYGDLDNSIATAGFITDVTSTNARAPYAGVDASCRWYPTEGKHYIFASTREDFDATNIPVTIRMVDQGQTTAHELHEDDDITIERGGAIPGGYCEFDDTFANAWSYKAYRID